MKLSVLILTKNEERNIERAIKSVLSIADEIIVLDSGSTDKTVEIAKNLGTTVFFREFDDYTSQINYGLSLCSGEWIFVLDADEELSKELQENIKRELENPKYECYEVPRRTYYLGRFLNYVWYPEYRKRLFKKGKVRYEGKIHEEVLCQGKVGRLEGDLYHYSYKDLYHQFIKTIDYAKKMAQVMHSQGKKFKLYKLILNPFIIFFKLYFFKFGFLEGTRGFIIAFSGFLYVFLKYAFLYELELKEKYKDKLWL
ncbi:glycosyltransferase family 2 protein [Sulfurihydrogenibium azorense]|uniref:glycosyltransferase family 2 protein n=1 Tax=Sulfurihydrogenibium azorense TaxID=309806 RepID=UPI002409D7C6|nr:glycosyltransferase family 2 protein [Sulfurihydrogenibium azorense]MDM7274185.1 glycosyltransferase family 2 protein [Sulfurihydrogenibium azorense]